MDTVLCFFCHLWLFQFIVRHMQICYNTIHRKMGAYYYYTVWLTFTSQTHSCNMFPGQETEHGQHFQKLLSTFFKSRSYSQGKANSWQLIGLFLFFFKKKGCNLYYFCLAFLIMHARITHILPCSFRLFTHINVYYSTS